MVCYIKGSYCKIGIIMSKLISMWMEKTVRLKSIYYNLLSLIINILNIINIL